METKLREVPSFMGSSLQVLLLLSLWGIAVLCLESLETLPLSSLCSFPYVAQLMVSSALLALHKVQSPTFPDYFL